MQNMKTTARVFGGKHNSGDSICGKQLCDGSELKHDKLKCRSPKVQGGSRFC